MISRFLSFYFRWKKIHLDREQSIFIEIQNELIQRIIAKNKSVTYLFKKNIVDLKTFQEYCPPVIYDDIEPYIIQIKNRKSNELTVEKVIAFSKSSGTTSRSKWIPMTKRTLIANFKAGRYFLALFISEFPKSKLTGGKNFSMTGSYIIENGFVVGDISSLFAYYLKPWFKPFRCPNLKLATISDWKDKLRKWIPVLSSNDIRWIAGVPSWMSVVIEKMEEKNQKSILEIWKNLEVFIYGGVNIEPYYEFYHQKFKGNVKLWQTYNASEGFFGMQAESKSSDMFFLHNTSNYYEFIKKEDIERPNPKIIPFADLELNRIYELVITNFSGLYRYRMGDLLEITSIRPIRFQIVGRTKNFINIFGEELMVVNTEAAISELRKEIYFEIRDYTIAPILNGNTGRHHWMIEFNHLPDDMDRFTSSLDSILRSINSDYDTKRYDDMILKPLTVEVIPRGSFESWLDVNHRLSVQSKIPKLWKDESIQNELRKL